MYCLGPLGHHTVQDYLRFSGHQKALLMLIRGNYSFPSSPSVWDCLYRRSLMSIGRRVSLFCPLYSAYIVCLLIWPKVPSWLDYFQCWQPLKQHARILYLSASKVVKLCREIYSSRVAATLNLLLCIHQCQYNEVNSAVVEISIAIISL